MVTTSACRAARQALLAEAAVAVVVEGEARARHLLQEALQQRRHVAQPQREEHHQVLRPFDALLCRQQAGGQRALFPFGGAAQQREIELRHIDAPDIVLAFGSAIGIGLRQRMAQVTTLRIGMTLDDENAFAAHAKPLSVASSARAGRHALRCLNRPIGWLLRTPRRTPPRWRSACPGR